MTVIAYDRSAPALAAAVEANMAEYLSVLGRLPQVEFHNDPDMIRFVTGIRHPLLNCVMGARLAPNDVDSRVDATLRWFAARNLPLTWYTGLSTRPPDLGTYLLAHGLIHADDSPGMAVDLRALNEDLPAPADLRIEYVGDRAALQQWLHPFGVGFELPETAASYFYDLFARSGFGSDMSFRHYVGRLGAAPVACSTLFLGTSVAGIYDVAVVPEVRRRGIGAAITLAPLREARALGYQVAVLFASAMGLPVYRRLGFQHYCAIGLYQSTAEGNSSDTSP